MELLGEVIIGNYSEREFVIELYGSPDFNCWTVEAVDNTGQFTRYKEHTSLQSALSGFRSYVHNCISDFCIDQIEGADVAIPNFGKHNKQKPQKSKRPDWLTDEMIKAVEARGFEHQPTKYRFNKKNENQTVSIPYGKLRHVDIEIIKKELDTINYLYPDVRETKKETSNG